jgi:PAS domain S-box-containing protein
MKNTLGNKIILFAFLLLLGTIVANSVVHIFGFRRNFVESLVQQSQNLGLALKGNVEKVLGLGVDLAALPGLSQKCLELVSVNVDISYCVVTDASDKALYSSDERFGHIRFDQKVDRLTTLLDERISIVQLANEKYYNTTTTLKSPDGKIAGFVQVGFPKSAINEKIYPFILFDLVVLILSFSLAFYLVVRFSKKYIIYPMSVILGAVRKIAHGEFQSRLPELGVEEFSELAKNINTMSETLKERNEQVLHSYEELAATHQKLQISYLQLEGLSLEVEQSEELYKALMEDSSDAIIVVDDHEQVKIVNKMAEEFFGYAAEEMRDLPITKLLLLLDINNIPRIHRLFRDAIEGHHSVEEITFRKKNSDEIIGRMNLSSVRSGDESLVQAIFRDITKEKEILENLSRSAADLARLNKMKDSFLGLASHELKTPLTVIMGYTELILTDMAEVVDPTVKEMVQNISNASLRLDSIVKDMVDVSMIDEQRLQLQLKEVDINALLETTAAELRLIQLFSNVLGNAIKFTPDSGTITVTTSAKYLSRPHTPHEHEVHLVGATPRESQLYVEVIIHDTGIGIDREEQVKIFDKFYEAGNIAEHSSGKVAFKAKGAGLGLAIAKGIVDVHGGDIWVESAGYNPEQFPGSAFHILLPVSPVPNGGHLDFTSLLK